MKKYVDFTQGNIVRAIILFSIPLIMGELLQNLYNSVDALVGSGDSVRDDRQYGHQFL